MTGSTQEDYAKMMIEGGRSVEGNRSRSGKSPAASLLAPGARRKSAKARAGKAKAVKSKSMRSKSAKPKKAKARSKARAKRG